MARVRAEALLGGAPGLLDEPRRYVRTERLGSPGEVLSGDDVVGRLLAVEEAPLTHVDIAPEVRERLSHALRERRTVFVHYVE